MNAAVSIDALGHEAALLAASRSAGLAVRFVDPCSETDWDPMVISHPGHTFFHSAAWAKVLVETYGFLPCYPALFDGSRLQALLPMMEASSWLNGRRGVSLPFTDECAPLVTDPTDAPLLLAAAQERGEHRKWKRALQQALRIVRRGRRNHFQSRHVTEPSLQTL